MTHRYPFDSDANDVVGSANGVLYGNTYLTNGAAVLDGTNSGVQLPNDLFTNYSSASFEIWFVDAAAPDIHTISRLPHLYFFGSSTVQAMGCDLAGRGYYQFQRVYIPLPIPGRTNHLVWTQDSTSKKACLYLNGLLAGENTNFTYTPALIGPTPTNWIGAGGAGSRVFRGSILEFRSYQGALSPLEVALLDAAGPDQPAVSPGALQQIRVVAAATAGPGALRAPVVLADFASLSNVNIIGVPELSLSSDNTNVISVLNQTNQVLMSNPVEVQVPLLRESRKLLTMQSGSADLTAVYEGYSNRTTVTVTAERDVALLHRYGFNEPTNTWIAYDTIGGAHGRLVGTRGQFTGAGELSFGVSGVSSYVAFPDGMISCLSEISLAAWLVVTGSSPWQRIFDFGDQTPANGYSTTTYFFLTPRTGNDSFPPHNVTRATISTNNLWAEMPRLNWTNFLPLNVPSHVAVTYSPARGIAKLYVNGVPVSSGDALIPLAAIRDVNCWLGRSQYINDAYFTGRLNELRIYSGLLSDADIAADYAAGPDVIGSDFLLHTIRSGTNLTLSWGQSASDLVLKSSPSLGAAAVWTEVSPSPTFADGRFSVTVPQTNATCFFRLQAP